MIFIVKDIHDEQRDRVGEVPLALGSFALWLSDNRQTCDKHPYEPAELERRRKWGGSRRNRH